MENASNALIIAGSILLSILIIALGMYIFSTSSSTSNVEILNETEIQTFNAKFEKYKGEQLGSNVDALVSALRTNASANKNSKEKLPKFTYTSNNSDKNKTNEGHMTDGKITTYTEALTAISDDLQSSHRYTVTMKYSDDGLISEINIKY